MVFGVMTRNNFRHDNKGAVQLDWALPLRNKFKGYLQYSYGYGESLVDYNHINHGVGLGIILRSAL